MTIIETMNGVTKDQRETLYRDPVTGDYVVRWRSL